MREFRLARGNVVLRLDHASKELLSVLLAQMIELVKNDDDDVDPLEALVGLSSEVKTPDDPALLRLLPSGCKEDQVRAVEYRKYTEIDLRSEKVDNYTLALQSLAVDAKDIVLTEEQIMAWLKSLTDIRLTLGVRLGIENDSDTDQLTDELIEANSFSKKQWDELPRTQKARLETAHIFEYLGGLQSLLLDCLT